MTKRVLIVATLIVIATAIVIFILQPETGVPEGAPTEEEMANEIGADVMTNLYRGHVPGRSGEVMLVPKPHNFLIGEWDLTTLGSAQPTMSTSHPNPWNYLARVPIIVYAPQWGPKGVTLDQQTDIAALAPTYAEILGGVEGFEGEADPLQGIGRTTGPCRGRDEGPGPCVVRPKVIFTVVVDGGGWNTLQQHSDSWPFMDSLRDASSTYVNATIGSAPSITGALHATVGTGVYPLTHGIPGNQMRGDNGENTDAWLHKADPRYLEAPTISELWDEQNDNKPIVGTVSYEGWHLGMIGSGAMREGGDKDLAVLWESQDRETNEPVNEWWINEDYYKLPASLERTDLETLERYEDELDGRDGLEDGSWYGHTVEELQEPLIRPGTPAFVRFTGDAVIDVMRSERIGRDDVTDMFWVEMKMPDYAGHAWNVLNAEQEDVLRETDRQLARMKAELDRTVGKNNYVFAVTADHGQQPLPDLYGGWRINNRELQRDLVVRFGDIVEKVTPVDIYFDRDRVASEGVDLADVARYLGTYTLGDNIPEGKAGEGLIPEDRRDELLFAGAFSTDFLGGLDLEGIQDFGPSEYPEGDLYLPFEQATPAP